MTRKTFLGVFATLVAAAFCLPVVARADGAISVTASGATVFASEGVHICSYLTPEEATAYNDYWFTQTPGNGELTNPEGGRQRFLKDEYSVPLEIAGGDEAFPKGLADECRWHSSDVSGDDGVYLASSDFVGTTSTGESYAGVLVGVVPKSQQPVEKAVITVNETNSAGQVTEFSISLVYSTGPAGTNVPVSGDAGVTMQMMPNSWIASYTSEGRITPKANASSLSADDAECKELVGSVEDGQIVGVYNLSFTPTIDGHESAYSRNFGTMWVSFAVDEKYNGNYVDVWDWQPTSSVQQDLTEGEPVLVGTYPVSGGKVTVPVHRLSQIVLSVQVDGSSYAMERLYNQYTGEHLYTPSTAERDLLTSLGWSYEGEAWQAPAKSDATVWRLFNPYSDDHHYTTSKVEYDRLVSVGWSGEGEGWYSAGKDGEPLYRLYNPFATTATHHYTASAEERDSLVKIGWNDEGIAWYGL